MNKIEKNLVAHLKEVSIFNVKISRSIHNILVELDNLHTCMSLVKKVNDSFDESDVTIRPLEFKKYCENLIESQNKLIASVNAIIKDAPKDL